MAEQSPIGAGLLADRVAVVTGACGILGRAIVRRLLIQGARVVMTDVSLDSLTRFTQSLKSEVVASEETLRWIVADASDEADVDASVNLAVAEFGGIDIWVNCAGFARDATMKKMSLQQFDDVINVHLRGAWLGTRAAAAWMREHGGGSIVNVGSLSGKVGNAGQTNYSAAKAGIVGLTKAAAKEVGFAGVRINAIQPGLIESAMLENLPSEVRERRLAEIPLGRFGTPEEVADTIVFLGSDMSRYITGAVIDISGGRHL